MTVGASRTGAAGAGAAGLVLMFEHGRRPDRAAIVEALECFPRASISFDPANADTSHHVAAELSQASRDTDWLELLLPELVSESLSLSKSAIRVVFGDETEPMPAALKCVARTGKSTVVRLNWS